MKIRATVGAVSVGAMLALGCGDSDEDGSGAPAPLIAFASYNVALGVGFSENPEARQAVIARDLPALEADVVCLQEVWQPSDVEALTAAAVDQFPNAYYSVTPSDEIGVGCTQEEADLLGGCLEDNCAGLPEDEVALCVVVNCVDEFTTVSSDCQGCIAANQSADPSLLAELCAPGGAGVERFDNQNGLLLLSRIALEDTDLLTLDSSLGDRGVLFARIQQDGWPSAALFCTHLAATQVSVPYTGDYGDWEGERHAQLERMLEYVEETRAEDEPAILMGDMNCGPETAEALPASPDTFALFTDAGYEAPYVEDPGDCTWCSSNPMTGGADDDVEFDVILDHVLLSEVPGDLPRSARRVYDDPVEIEVDGQAVETYRSDHFGVLVTLSEPED